MDPRWTRDKCGASYCGLVRKLSLWMRAHPTVGDGLIAVLLALLDGFIYTAAQLNPHAPGMPAWYITIPVDIAMVAPLVIRRKYPLVSSYLILLIGAVHSLLELGATSLITGTMAVYTLVVYTTRKHAAVFVTILAVGSGVQLFFQYEDEFLLQFLAMGVLTAFPWVLGEFVGARRAYQRELEARLALLETERDQAARMAVSQERGRIARELHDVVAHSVSVIVVQADGASYALRTSPELAERAVHTISETGRSALAELRRLLDVLRNEDATGEPRVPQPDTDELAELVDRVRAAGLDVRVDLDGDLGTLPAGVSLGVYRIVQESLTNTLKHAGDGARAVVTVRRSEAGVCVEVSDDGAGKAHQLTPVGDETASQGGNGVIGMRERAQVYDGSLEAGPDPGGGWRVRAVLPAGLA